MSGFKRKETIRTEMLKEIAQTWGFKTSDVEKGGFDPLVYMLLGACASEFENVSKQIHDTSNRVLKRLTELLTPDVLTNAQPAHAILHSRSLEPISLIGAKNEFYHTHTQQEETKDIYFSPIHTTTIFNADIKYLAHNNQIVPIEDIIHTKKGFTAITGKKIAPTHLWIGLEIDQGIDTLENMAFHFDWSLDAEKKSHLYLLPYTKWFVNEQELAITTGLNYHDSIDNNLLSEVNDLNRKVEDYIRREYHHHFITLKGFKEATIDEQIEQEDRVIELGLPDVIKSVFSEKDLKEIGEDLLWIRIEFPEAMPPSAIQQTQCLLNCFPVVNRRLYERSFSLRSKLNILPLESSDYFFLFKRLTNQDGLPFKYVSSTDFDELNGGTFTLRKGGIKRFDQRNASEMVSSLLDMLREESASFSALKLDIFSSDIKDLNQIINRIHQKSRAAQKQVEPTPYLMVNPKEKGDTVYAEFWTTNGVFANKVVAGTKPVMDKEVIVDRNSIVFVTTTTGGRDSLQSEKLVGEYKKALMTRGRVVTKEDIKLFCKAKFNDNLARIEIKKGFEIDHRPNVGIIRTSQVVLEPVEGAYLAEEWTIQCEELERELNDASTGIIPIRVVSGE